MICYNLPDKAGRRRFCALLMLTAGMLAACGKEAPAQKDQAEVIQTGDKELEMSPTITEDDTKEQIIKDADLTTNGSEGTADTGEDVTGNPKTDEIRERFGENCISEQTFEVELSEYNGKVWFVPYAPVKKGQELNIQIVQDGEILTQLYPYVPEQLEGQPFTSLDAVSFFDINYDNYTDIVLIETYGNTTFAAVYYGFAAEADEEDRTFDSQWSMSEAISNKVKPLTIGEIRNQLGKKSNGEFATYQEAYTAIVKLLELEYGSDLSGDLIYVDDDDIPELAVGHTGYWVSLYTYHAGRTYILMDHWAYGAMGNVGYEYIPRGNRLRNYNSDYAGAIRYNTYMAMNDQYSLQTVTQIVTYNFDDVNGNGYPDEDEQDSIGYYGVSYVDGTEITNEQYTAYEAGEYEYIHGSMSLDELYKRL